MNGNIFSRLRGLRGRQENKDAARKQFHQSFPRALMPMENDYLHDKFGYGATRAEDEERLVRIKNAARDFTNALMENGTPTPELQEAIDAVRMAMFWAQESVCSGRQAEERKAAMIAKQREVEEMNIQKQRKEEPNGGQPRA